MDHAPADAKPPSARSAKPFSRWFTRPATPGPRDAAAESLMAFASETDGPAPAAAKTRPGPRIALRIDKRAWIAAAAAGTAVVAAVAIVWPLRADPKPAAVPEFGRLTITSRTPGALVSVDGVGRGATPLDMPLTPGAHTVVLRQGTDEKTVPLTLAAGERVSQYFDFDSTPAVSATGKLSVATDRGAARILVDGRAAGTSPIVLSDLVAGDHTVSVTTDAGTVERRVKVEPGTTTSVVFSTPQTPGASGGWVAVAAPFEVKIFDDTEFIGSSAAAKVMLAAGKHDLRLSNELLGFAETRHVDVVPGKTNQIKLAAPNAAVSINAKPWADVLVDGSPLGQTPLANVTLAVGTHEVVFRHPQLGERRQTAVVTVTGPNRVTADLTQR